MTINQRKGLILLKTEKTYATKKDRKEVLGPEKDIYLLFWGLKGKPNRTEPTESGSFRSYSRSVRSFRPEFRGESFRPNWGGSFRSSLKDGSFRPDFRGESFRPDFFILGKTV